MYEHVYETVDVQGNPEIRASATAKVRQTDGPRDVGFGFDCDLSLFQATVAAFAASEGHAHPRVVELPKTEEGLGFNVMGGKEQNSPIYISRIIPGQRETVVQLFTRLRFPEFFKLNLNFICEISKMAPSLGRCFFSNRFKFIRFFSGIV